MVTQVQVGEHLDLNPRHVRELRDRLIIPDPRSATLDEIRVAYIRYLRDYATGRSTPDASGKVLSLSDERARLAHEQSRSHALKNAELEGELVNAAEVVKTWSNHITAAKRRLRAIPKQMASVVAGFTPKMAVQAQKLIDEALHDLASGAADDEKKPTRKTKPQRKSSKPRKRPAKSRKRVGATS